MAKTFDGGPTIPRRQLPSGDICDPARLIGSELTSCGLFPNTPTFMMTVGSACVKTIERLSGA